MKEKQKRRCCGKKRWGWTLIASSIWMKRRYSTNWHQLAPTLKKKWGDLVVQNLTQDPVFAKSSTLGITCERVRRQLRLAPVAREAALEALGWDWCVGADVIAERALHFSAAGAVVTAEACILAEGTSPRLWTAQLVGVNKSHDTERRVIYMIMRPNRVHGCLFPHAERLNSAMLAVKAACEPAVVGEEGRRHRGEPLRCCSATRGSRKFAASATPHIGTAAGAQAGGRPARDVRARTGGLPAQVFRAPGARQAGGRLIVRVAAAYSPARTPLPLLPPVPPPPTASPTPPPSSLSSSRSVTIMYLWWSSTSCNYVAKAGAADSAAAAPKHHRCA